MSDTSPASEPTIWVVVADSSRADVYTLASRRGSLQKRTTFENEAGRMRAAQLASDRDGRSFDSHGKGRHAMASENNNSKIHLTKAFAKEIAEYIVAGRNAHVCREVAVIAAPRFLGYLREAMAVSSNVAAELMIDKDVVGHDEKVIEKMLRGAWRK